MSRSDSSQTYEIEKVTADKTIKRDDLPRMYHNVGAAAAITLTLPNDARGGEVVELVSSQVSYAFSITGPSNVRIYASNGTSWALQAADATITATNMSESIKLVAISQTRWMAVRQIQMDALTKGFDSIS